MKKVGLFLMVLLSLTLVSCASLFSKSNYNINVQSNPSHASFEVYDLSTGMLVGQGETPSVINLSASDNFLSGARYRFVFSKPGYDDTIVVIKAGVDGWYWGNLLVGGLIGMLIVDPVTGAMFSLPEHIFANLRKTRSSVEDLKVIDINTIPEELRKELVKIT